MQREAAHSVLELARKINATAPIDCLPAQPAKTVYLGAQASPWWCFRLASPLPRGAGLLRLTAGPSQRGPFVFACVRAPQYVNNSTLSDITFLVEEKKFYAHRIALLASSDAFRAMFSGGYREKVRAAWPLHAGWARARPHGTRALCAASSPASEASEPQSQTRCPRLRLHACRRRPPSRSPTSPSGSSTA